MGASLFAKFPREVAVADSILGVSIERLCLEDPREELNRTDRTQPALYVVNALTYLDRLREGHPPPDVVAGHSLGEYNALFAAGVFDFATGLRLVRKRGALMAQANGGGMAAVLGLSLEKMREVLADARFSEVDIANLNSPSQIVVSGPADQVDASADAFEKAGARMVMRLKVSAAFHSRAMVQAADAFRRFIEPVELAPPRIPVIANVTARPYGPHEARELLVQQITAPVRWTESVQYLLREPDVTIEEIGPGTVLSGLVRQIRAAHANAA